MKSKTKSAAVAVLIPLAVGGFSALLTASGMRSFDFLLKPPLSPPKWLFPVAWTILYILMGLASYFVWSSNSPKRKRALTFYGVQLLFNFFWSIIFFNAQAYLFAFIWIIALWLLIVITTLLFGEISKKAAYLFVPYLLWVSFAAYLNFGIYVLN